MRRNNYEMDCLWAQATGFQFAESNAPKEPQKYITKATLPRWYEYMEPQTESFQKDGGDDTDIFAVIDAIAQS